jgi:hypothetical protein
MNRRSFLGALLSGAALYVVSRLPWTNYGAVFRVSRVDPEGSGMDYRGLLGATIYNGSRCCKNCEIIFGAFSPGGDVDNGPSFIDTELTAVNPAARRILAEVAVSKRRYSTTEFALATPAEIDEG